MARTIQDITARIPADQSTRGPTRPESFDVPSKQKVVELFARIQNTFGHRFASLFPDKDSKLAAMRDWHRQLVGITDDEIELGFGRLASRSRDTRDWPPGALEFRSLCRPHREPYERQEFQARALPLHPASPEFAQSHIDALRERARIQHEEVKDAETTDQRRV